MAGERVSKILKSKTSLSSEDIELISDKEGWRLIYSFFPTSSKFKKRVYKKENQICFTGLPAEYKKELQGIAISNGMEVVKSITKDLAYLCCGEKAGPIKLKKAIAQDVIVMSVEQFTHLLNTGEVPI